MSKIFRRRKPRGRFLFASAAALAGYVGVARPKLMNWGAEADEIVQPLPGDELVAEAIMQTTRAIDIQASPEAVWPWVVQIGYQRGGFYSYDFLENLAGLGIRSAGEIRPELQDVKVGDQIYIAPDTPLNVTTLEPNQALVLHGVMNPFTAQAIETTAGYAGPYMDWTWAFVLQPVGEGATRLLIRVRADYGPRGVADALRYSVLEPAHFLMEQKMLKGIKERAEGAASQDKHTTV